MQKCPRGLETSWDLTFRRADGLLQLRFWGEREGGSLSGAMPAVAPAGFALCF
jgi:hypothetical protein